MYNALVTTFQVTAMVLAICYALTVIRITEKLFQKFKESRKDDDI